MILFGIVEDLLYNKSMRRFLAEQINNDKVILEGVEHNHLKNVLRLKEGEEVLVVCGDEYDYTCVIEKISKGDSVLRVVDKALNTNNPKADITVFQALTKHDNMSLIVQKLTELGVKTFIPFESQFITSKDKYSKQEKLQVISNQSIKQCKRSIPMQVKETLSFNNVVKQLKEYDVVIFANETEKTKNLNEVKLTPNQKVAIIIGSEGGFSDLECDKIIEAGAISVSLGKRILRAETASIALTGVVMYLMGEWDYEI